MEQDRLGAAVLYLADESQRWLLTFLWSGIENVIVKGVQAGASGPMSQAGRCLYEGL